MTTKLTSRDETLSTCIKVQVDTNNCNYLPLQLTDKVAYELATHFYTVEEIASFFNVSAETVLAHHGDAFRKGKLTHSVKPRILFDKMLTDVMNAVVNYADKDAEHLFNRATKLIEMKWKKCEGYGKEAPPPGLVTSALAHLSDEELAVQLERLGFVKKA